MWGAACSWASVNWFEILRTSRVKILRRELIKDWQGVVTSFVADTSSARVQVCGGVWRMWGYSVMLCGGRCVCVVQRELFVVGVYWCGIVSYWGGWDYTEHSARTAQWTHYGCVIKTSPLMLYREIMAVCSQIHTKHINTLCGQNVELLNVKLVVRIVTSGLQRVKSLL